ncbi:MAG: phage tail protein I [Asticcacaulis sp.]
MAHLLPPNATDLEKAMAEAVQVTNLPRPIKDLWNPDTCPVELLPWLAWALSIETWSASWPESVRRSHIKTAIEVQQIRGTKRAVMDVIAGLGGFVVLREWFEQTPRGEPGTFDLFIDLGSRTHHTAADIDSVIREVRRTKPASRHFTFNQSTDAAGEIHVSGTVRVTGFVRLSATRATDDFEPTFLTTPETEFLNTPEGDFLIEAPQ